MPVRRTLIAVAVLAVTGASAGGAAYAATGPSPTTPGKSPTPPACAAKVVADSAGDQDERLAAAAAKLGVSQAKLTDALVSTKQWIGGTAATPTPAVFSGHVATLLGLDPDRVSAALTSSGILDAGPAKPGTGDKDGKDDPGDKGDQSQNVVAAAQALGVSPAQLDTALVTTKQWLGSSVAKPTPAAFLAHVAALLGKPADQVERALDANGIFRATPNDKAAPPADKACVADSEKAGTTK